MIAFEVTLNGKRICVAGAEDLNMLTASVDAMGRLGPKAVPQAPWGMGRSLRFLVSGTNSARDVYRYWKLDALLTVGDVVQVRMVDVEDADPPEIVVRSDEGDPAGAEARSSKGVGRMEWLEVADADRGVTALEVMLNGERVCVAGAEDLNALMAMVQAGGKLGSETIRRPGEGSGRGAHFDVCGMNLHNGRGRFWKTQAPMALSDVFEVKIVEVDDADPPEAVVPVDKGGPECGGKKGRKWEEIGDWLK